MRRGLQPVNYCGVAEGRLSEIEQNISISDVDGCDSWHTKAVGKYLRGVQVCVFYILL